MGDRGRRLGVHHHPRPPPRRPPPRQQLHPAWPSRNRCTERVSNSKAAPSRRKRRVRRRRPLPRSLGFHPELLTPLPSDGLETPRTTQSRRKTTPGGAAVVGPDEVGARLSPRSSIHPRSAGSSKQAGCPCCQPPPPHPSEPHRGTPLIRGHRPDFPDRCPRAGEPPSSPAAAATTPQAATSKPGHGRPAADPERGAAATPSQRQQQQPAPHAPHPHATPTSQRQRQAPTQPAVGGGPPGPDRARKPRRHAAEQLEDAQPTTQPPGTRTRGPCRAATPHASAASRPGAPPRGSPPREEARGAPPPPTLTRLRPGVPLGGGEGGSRGEGAGRRRR